MNYKGIGKRLKRMRLERGMTQDELSNKAGVSQAHIAKIENRKVDPRVSTLNKIFSVLHKEGKKCKGIMTREIITSKPDEEIDKAIRRMNQHKISQLPVIKENKVVGKITEKDITSNFEEDLGSKKVEKIMGDKMPVVPPETTLKAIKPLLGQYQAILVGDKRGLRGIISRSDLLKAI